MKPFYQEIVLQSEWMILKRKKGGSRPSPQSVEKGFAEFAAKAANPSKSFSTAACTWAKTLLRLQVCELCANGAQGVRAADCKKPSKSPKGDFRRPESTSVSEVDILFHRKICW